MSDVSSSETAELAIDFLNAAIEAIAYVKKYIWYSDTEPRFDVLTLENKKIVYDIISILRSETPAEDPITTARLSLDYQAGNCSEQSCVAFAYLSSLGIPAEIYHIVGGDHSFVVLNRKIDSISTDPQAWGNAIICDPWAKLCYPVSQLYEKLCDLYQDSKTGRRYSRLFNPLKQSLEPFFNTINRRICTSDEARRKNSLVRGRLDHDVDQKPSSKTKRRKVIGVGKSAFSQVPVTVFYRKEREYDTAITPCRVSSEQSFSPS